MKEFNDIINVEANKSYFINLMKFIDQEYHTKKICPKREDIFKAFELTKLNDIKVVLIGQDPYATPGYAMGLSFSVNDGIKIPKSLMNIYKEINQELGLKIPNSGNLTNWAKKGILLLNLILTVEENKPLSHKNKGWEIFTKRIIEEINQLDQKIVFILLGNPAHSIAKYLNNPKHLVLETSHPSPLGAYHGFIGSNVFKRTIDYLELEKDFWSIEH